MTVLVRVLVVVGGGGGSVSILLSVIAIVGSYQV